MQPATGSADVESPQGEGAMPSTTKQEDDIQQERLSLRDFFKREWRIFWGMLKSSYLNWLLILSPVAMGLGFSHVSAVGVFVVNFLALIPLALLLGDVTEHLADRYGDVVGGLLNATFGNVVEIVLALQALRHDQYMLVEMSLIGSVLSNLLLVLGCCYLAGGYYHHILEFTIDTNLPQMVLLFTAIMALCLPSAVPFVIPDINVEKGVQRVSHCTAILLFFGYCAYLFFQLKTHPELCEEEDEDDDEDGNEDEENALADKGDDKHKLQPIQEGEGDAAAQPAKTRTASGRSVETHRTASGRMMEMIRTASGRLQDMRDNNKVWPDLKSDNTTKTLSGRTTSGRTTSGGRQSGRHSNSGLRGGGSMKLPRNELGMPLTSQEIIDLNRARRMSGRPPLPQETVSAARAMVQQNKGSLDVPLVPRTSASGAEEEEEEQILSTPFALLVLAGISALVAINCEFLTESIQEFSLDTGLSEPFLAMIVLPIAGNACEHMSAVFMAMKNRMNLALGIAVGSGLQISMLAVPFLSLIGWFISKPFLLSIDLFALFSTIISVILTHIVVASGKCNWVYSVGPIALYIIIGVVYFYRTASVGL